MKDLIEGIKKRDASSVRYLVASRQRLLFSVALSCGAGDDAADVVQQTWERALLKIDQLRDSDSATAWLCRICRNICIDRSRKKGLDEVDIDQLVNTSAFCAGADYEDYLSLLRLAVQMLGSEQRRIVNLRYYAQMSYAEIASVCGIESGLVKSRLFEARRKLKSYLRDLYDGFEVPQNILNGLEDYVMNEFEKHRVGAEVFCRLSLYAQMKLICCVVDGGDFDEELLREIGRTREGGKFAELFHKKLLTSELAGILAACDRYTEVRLVKGLEYLEPHAAEFVKQNTFVFEDVAILSERSRSTLLSRVDESVMQRAMSISDARVKEKILSSFADEKRAQWYGAIGASDADLDSVKDAQAEVVRVLRLMDAEDLVEIAEW